MEELHGLIREGFFEIIQLVPDWRKLQNIRYQLQLPLFDGRNPREWVWKMERYFQPLWLSEEEEFRVACVALDGEAWWWFGSEHRRRPFYRWDEMKLLLVLRFGSSPASFWERPAAMRFSGFDALGFEGGSVGSQRSSDGREGCMKVGATGSGPHGRLGGRNHGGGTTIGGGLTKEGGFQQGESGLASGLNGSGRLLGQERLMKGDNQGGGSKGGREGEGRAAGCDYGGAFNMLPQLRRLGGEFVKDDADGIGGCLLEIGDLGGGGDSLDGEGIVGTPARREERRDEGEVADFGSGGDAGGAARSCSNGGTIDWVYGSNKGDEVERILEEDEVYKDSLTSCPSGLQKKKSLEGSKGNPVNCCEEKLAKKSEEERHRRPRANLIKLGEEMQCQLIFSCGPLEAEPNYLFQSLKFNCAQLQLTDQPLLFPRNGSKPNDYHAHSQPNPLTKVLKLHFMAPRCNFSTQPKAIKGLINEDLERQWKPGISLRNNNLKGYQGKYLGTEYYPP